VYLKGWELFLRIILFFFTALSVANHRTIFKFSHSSPPIFPDLTKWKGKMGQGDIALLVLRISEIASLSGDCNT
jgi:hypothetical protein